LTQTFTPGGRSKKETAPKRKGEKGRVAIENHGGIVAGEGPCCQEKNCGSLFRVAFSQEPVGLRKSKRKFGWARTDFVDFAGQ
jgi:hypothetical protein